MALRHLIILKLPHMTLIMKIIFALVVFAQCKLALGIFNFCLVNYKHITAKVILVAANILFDVVLYIIWRCLIRPRFSVLRDLPQPPVRNKVFFSLIRWIFY